VEVGYDVAVIGGGPAGCAAAISASRAGLRTILFERGCYPRHKVCGEFVSPESHKVLVALLGTDHPIIQTPATIRQARMFSDGKQILFDLPKPAWSISRYHLDNAMWQAANCVGVECQIMTTVERIDENRIFVGGDSVLTKTIINASGRWSNLRRPQLNVGAHWIGLKAHFKGEHAPPSTDIYFFRGGYCGVQPLAGGTVNASAMVRSDVATSMEEVLAASPELWLRSRAWDQATDTISTSPLIHASPQPLTGSVMNAGDAAGFVDPFVGDGISLALQSGVLAAHCAGNPQQYQAEYRRRFANVFQAAALARRLANASAFFRRLAILGFQSEMIRDFALSRTRAR
jgi:flavin-dependent dehydrogenase